MGTADRRQRCWRHREVRVVLIKMWTLIHSFVSDLPRLKTYFHAYKEEIRDGLKDISKGAKKDDGVDELFHHILYCLQPAVRSRIRIFSLDGDLDLDDTIFEAIIHGNWSAACVVR